MQPEAVEQTAMFASAKRFPHPRFVFAAVAAALLAAGVAWQWSWLVAIGVAPVLASAAPCAAMCALGLCAMRIGNGSCAAQAPPDPANRTAIAKSPSSELEEAR